MTREEAIERMKIIKGDCYIIDDPKDKEAFDMSIFALEQEPYELLIIKSDILLHQEDRKKWIESIKREKENGVIILPPYFTSLLVPNDVEIRIEQPCDDAISRQAVLDGLKECMCEDWVKTLFATMVKQLPSVTQKSGKWIEDAKTYYEELNKRGLGVDEYTPYFTDDIACSECLAKYNTIDNETEFFKYCPNCGAKMGSEE